MRIISFDPISVSWATPRHESVSWTRGTMVSRVRLEGWAKSWAGHFWVSIIGVKNR